MWLVCHRIVSETKFSISDDTKLGNLEKYKTKFSISDDTKLSNLEKYKTKFSISDG